MRHTGPIVAEVVLAWSVRRLVWVESKNKQEENVKISTSVKPVVVGLESMGWGVLKNREVELYTYVTSYFIIYMGSQCCLNFKLSETTGVRRMTPL